LDDPVIATPAMVDGRVPERPHPVELSWSALLRGIVPRFGCAAILIIAVALKTHELVTHPAPALLHGSRWLTTGLVEYEYILAVWLLSGFRPSWCRRVSLATFAGFGCYALYQAMSGAASCGCFGHVRVNPWLTLTLDAGLAVLLWRWDPYLGGACRELSAGLALWTRIPSSFRIAMGLAILGVPTLAIAGWGGGTRATIEESLANERLVVLEPEQWIGKRFPLFDYIDIGEYLATGSWILVIYHHDCPKCREAIGKYARLAHDSKQADQDVQVALIQVPPYGTIGPIANPIRWRGKLSDRKEWFVITPSEVRITHGQVTAASSRKDPQ